MNQHHLTSKQLDDFYRDEVGPSVFRDHKSSLNPTLVLLGAQPAAGKSQSKFRLRQQYPDLVPLDGDVLCQFHPDYAELMETDPVAMPIATAQASRAWMRMSIDHAREEGYSLLLENTFHNPDMTTDTAREFADAGYRVHVVALGVDEKISRIDSVNRYLSPGPDTDRWAPAAAHDLGYRHAPDTVQACEDSPDVHQVTITDRSGESLFTNQRGPDGLWQGPIGARDALLAARDRTWETEYARSWLELREHCTADMIERGDLDERTLPTFEQLHRDADEVAERAWPDPEDDRSRRRHGAIQLVHRHILDSAASGTPNRELPRRADAFLDQEPHGAHAQLEHDRRQDLPEEQKVLEEQVRTKARELARPRQQAAKPETDHDPSPPRGRDPDRDLNQDPHRRRESPEHEP